jgi:outer membrane immunogenic protein
MKVRIPHFALSVALALTAFFVASSAAWAEGRTHRKTPPDAAPNWTGCYLAGFVGGAWGGSVNATEARLPNGGEFYNDPGTSYDYGLGSSVTFGAALGCNYHIPRSMLVLGLEGELGTFRLRGSTLDPNTAKIVAADTVDSTRLGDGYRMLSGRIGVPIQNSLVYLKAGVAWLDERSSIVDTCTTVPPCGKAVLNASGSQGDTAWVIGGGLEYALTENWSLRAEYLRFGQLADYQVCGPAIVGATTVGQVCSTHEVDPIHVVRLGISYKLGP